MTRVFSLAAPLLHAQHRLEAAERLLRMLARKEVAARQRLEELQGYQAEYRLRLSNAGAAGLSIHALRDYHAFLAKVEVAIAHQTEELARARANWQAGHLQWLAQRRQVQAYEVLAQRHQRREWQREARREQGLTDETAARARHLLGE